MKMPRPPSLGRGFILIYVAAILVFVTVLVLHSSQEVRRAAQVSVRMQEYAAAGERLSAAAILLKARLGLQWTQANVAQRNLTLFIDPPAGTVEIDGVTISVSLEDADLRPDANLFTADDWARLLNAYGMSDEESRRLAENINALRLQVGGFQDIADLTGMPELPSNLLQGFTARGGERYPGLAELLSVAGGSRRLHVANSPLVLFAALNAPPEQISRLREIRRSRQATLADAKLIFGADTLRVCYDGNPERLRARLEIDGVPLRLEFELSLRNGQPVFTTPRSSNAA